MRSLVLICVLLYAVPAAANDPWWGRDKALHLAVGAAVGSVCYGTLWAVGADSAGPRLLWCTTLGQLPGLAKEIYDAGQPNNYFSGKDLMWTGIGVVASALLMFAIDKLTDEPSQPARATTESAPTLLMFDLAIGGH